MGCWKLRRLGLLGKITVLKSLVASQLTYIFSPLQSNNKVIKEINGIFYNFLWNDKGDKIKRNVMINDYPEGGLKMIDITSFNRSLKAIWIKKYLDAENQGSWKSFFDLELRKYGGEVTFAGNLNKKDSCNIIKVSDPFIKEILEIWSEANFEQILMSDNHFLSSPLWYNSLIRIENKPIFYKDWFIKGVKNVKHLMDDSRNFLSLTVFQNKYNLKVRPLAFYGLISAVKLLKGHISQNTRVLLKYESFLSKFVVNSKPSRLVYKKLVSKKSESPSPSQQKWLEDINIMINWKTVYQLSSQCTKSTKLIAFNFKFLHRRLSTNNFLNKIRLVESENCTFCQRETETLVHLFWECTKVQSFRISLSSWLQLCNIHTYIHTYINYSSLKRVVPL